MEVFDLHYLELLKVVASKDLSIGVSDYSTLKSQTVVKMQVAIVFAKDLVQHLWIFFELKVAHVAQ